MALAGALNRFVAWASDFETIKSAGGLALAWGAGIVTAWWKGRERYQAHVTWETMGPEDWPVIVIQSVDELPINVIRVRILNVFRFSTGVWPFDSEDPDYPAFPRVIEPKSSTRIYLNPTALSRTASRFWVMRWLWVPRVYVGVTTMGRAERLFVGEGGLPYDKRRSRYKL